MGSTYNTNTRMHSHYTKPTAQTIILKSPNTKIQACMVILLFTMASLTDFDLLY